MSKCKVFLKIISLMVAGIFLYQQILWAAGDMADLAKVISSKRDIAYVDTQSDIRTSNEFGQLDRAHAGTTEDIIINIQDCHSSLSAQYSIVDILKDLLKNYDLKVIAIEGGSGYLDTSLLKSFPDSRIKEKTAAYLMKEGKISAGEFFSVTTDEDIALYGVENNILYQENLKVFRDIYAKNRDNITVLNVILDSLKDSENRIYSQGLNRMVYKSRLHRDSKIGFDVYWGFLEKICEEAGISTGEYTNIKSFKDSVRQEKDIDFGKATSERKELINELMKDTTREDMEEVVIKSLSFEKGEIDQLEYHRWLLEVATEKSIEISRFSELCKFAAYAESYRNLDVMGLQNDIDQVEGKILEKLFSSQEERQLYRLVRMAELLKSLFEIRLTGEDMSYLAANINDIIADDYTYFISKGEKDVPNETCKHLEKSISEAKEALRFYNLAEKRNHAMIANTVSAMKRENKHVAALISGGHHSSGLTQIMKEKGLSYLVLMPKFFNDQSRPYVAVLTKKTGPYRQLVSSGTYDLALEAYFDTGNLKKFESMIAFAVGQAVLEEKDVSTEIKNWLKSYSAYYNNLSPERKTAMDSEPVDPKDLKQRLEQIDVVAVDAQSCKVLIGGSIYRVTPESMELIKPAEGKAQEIFPKGIKDLFGESDTDHLSSLLLFFIGLYWVSMMLSAQVASQAKVSSLGILNLASLDWQTSIALFVAAGLGLGAAIFFAVWRIFFPAKWHLRKLNSNIEALSHESEKVRESAARTLGEIGDRKAVQPLMKALLEDQKAKVRGVAAEALGKIGDEEAIPGLIEALKDKTQERGTFIVSDSASIALEKIGKPTVTALIKASKDEDWRVRAYAILILAEIKDERAIPAFKKALKDEEKRVSEYAAEALKGMGLEEAAQIGAAEDISADDEHNIQTLIGEIHQALCDMDEGTFKERLSILENLYGFESIFLIGRRGQKRITNPWSAQAIDPIKIVEETTIADLVKEIGFSDVKSGRIIRSTLGLAENIQQHVVSGYGVVLIREIYHEKKGKGIELIALDDGPGIKDINLAVKRGVSLDRKAGGAGMAMPNLVRDMDYVEIASRGKIWFKTKKSRSTELQLRGTKVLARKWVGNRWKRSGPQGSIKRGLAGIAAEDPDKVLQEYIEKGRVIEYVKDKDTGKWLAYRLKYIEGQSWRVKGTSKERVRISERDLSEKQNAVLNSALEYQFKKLKLSDDKMPSFCVILGRTVIEWGGKLERCNIIHTGYRRKRIWIGEHLFKDFLQPKSSQRTAVLGEELKHIKDEGYTDSYDAGYKSLLARVAEYARKVDKLTRALTIDKLRSVKEHITVLALRASIKAHLEYGNFEEALELARILERASDGDYHAKEIVEKIKSFIDWKKTKEPELKAARRERRKGEGKSSKAELRALDSKIKRLESQQRDIEKQKRKLDPLFDELKRWIPGHNIHRIHFGELGATNKDTVIVLSLVGLSGFALLSASVETQGLVIVLVTLALVVGGTGVLIYRAIKELIRIIKGHPQHLEPSESALPVDAPDELSAHPDGFVKSHVRRVTKIAGLLAREMGLSQDLTAKIRVAATMHDFGSPIKLADSATFETIRKSLSDKGIEIPESKSRDIARYEDLRRVFEEKKGDFTPREIEVALDQFQSPHTLRALAENGTGLSSPVKVAILFHHHIGELEAFMDEQDWPEDEREEVRIITSVLVATDIIENGMNLFKNICLRGTDKAETPEQTLDFLRRKGNIIKTEVIDAYQAIAERKDPRLALIMEEAGVITSQEEEDLKRIGRSPPLQQRALPETKTALAPEIEDYIRESTVGFIDKNDIGELKARLDSGDEATRSIVIRTIREYATQPEQKPIRDLLGESPPGHPFKAVSSLRMSFLTAGAISLSGLGVLIQYFLRNDVALAMLPLIAASFYFSIATFRYYLLGQNVYSALCEEGFSPEDAAEKHIARSTGYRHNAFYRLPAKAQQLIMIHESYQSHRWGMFSIMPFVYMINRFMKRKFLKDEIEAAKRGSFTDLDEVLTELRAKKGKKLAKDQWESGGIDDALHLCKRWNPKRPEDIDQEKIRKRTRKTRKRVESKIRKGWRFKSDWKDGLFLSQIEAEIIGENVSQSVLDKKYYCDAFEMLDNLTGEKLLWTNEKSASGDKKLHFHLLNIDKPLPIERYDLKPLCNDANDKEVVFTVQGYPKDMEEDNPVAVFAVKGYINSPDDRERMSARCHDVEEIVRRNGYTVDKIITQGKDGEVTVFLFPRKNGYAQFSPGSTPKLVGPVAISGVWTLPNQKEYQDFSFDDIQRIFSDIDVLREKHEDFEVICKEIKRNFHEAERTGLLPPSVYFRIFEAGPEQGKGILGEAEIVDVDAKEDAGDAVKAQVMDVLERQRRIIDLMLEKGVHRINFVLNLSNEGLENIEKWSSVISLLEHAKKKGMTTVLSLKDLVKRFERLKDRLMEIQLSVLPWVDKVSFEVERESDQLKSALDKIGQYCQKRTVEIHTYVTSQEQKEMIALAKLFQEKLSNVKEVKWKIIRDIESEEAMDEEEYEKLTSMMRVRFPNSYERKSNMQINYISLGKEAANLYAFGGGILGAREKGEMKRFADLFDEHTLEEKNAREKFTRVSTNIQKFHTPTSRDEGEHPPVVIEHVREELVKDLMRIYKYPELSDLCSHVYREAELVGRIAEEMEGNLSDEDILTLKFAVLVHHLGHYTRVGKYEQEFSRIRSVLKSEYPGKKKLWHVQDGVKYLLEEQKAEGLSRNRKFEIFYNTMAKLLKEKGINEKESLDEKQLGVLRSLFDVREYALDILEGLDVNMSKRVNDEMETLRATLPVDLIKNVKMLLQYYGRYREFLEQLEEDPGLINVESSISAEKMKQLIAVIRISSTFINRLDHAVRKGVRRELSDSLPQAIEFIIEDIKVENEEGEETLKAVNNLLSVLREFGRNPRILSELYKLLKRGDSQLEHENSMFLRFLDSGVDLRPSSCREVIKRYHDYEEGITIGRYYKWAKRSLNVGVLAIAAGSVSILVSGIGAAFFFLIAGTALISGLWFLLIAESCKEAFEVGFIRNWHEMIVNGLIVNAYGYDEIMQAVNKLVEENREEGKRKPEIFLEQMSNLMDEKVLLLEDRNVARLISEGKLKKARAKGKEGEYLKLVGRLLRWAYSDSEIKTKIRKSLREKGPEGVQRFIKLLKRYVTEEIFSNVLFQNMLREVISNPEIETVDLEIMEIDRHRKSLEREYVQAYDSMSKVLWGEGKIGKKEVKKIISEYSEEREERGYKALTKNERYGIFLKAMTERMNKAKLSNIENDIAQIIFKGRRCTEKDFRKLASIRTRKLTKRLVMARRRPRSGVLEIADYDAFSMLPKVVKKIIELQDLYGDPGVCRSYSSFPSYYYYTSEGTVARRLNRRLIKDMPMATEGTLNIDKSRKEQMYLKEDMWWWKEGDGVALTGDLSEDLKDAIAVLQGKLREKISVERLQLTPRDELHFTIAIIENNTTSPSKNEDVQGRRTARIEKTENIVIKALAERKVGLRVSFRLKQIVLTNSGDIILIGEVRNPLLHYIRTSMKEDLEAVKKDIVHVTIGRIFDEKIDGNTVDWLTETIMKHRSRKKFVFEVGGVKETFVNLNLHIFDQARKGRKNKYRKIRIPEHVRRIMKKELVPKKGGPVVTAARKVVRFFKGINSSFGEISDDIKFLLKPFLKRKLRFFSRKRLNERETDRDLSGPKAGDADPLIQELIKSGRIVEVFSENGRLAAYRLRWIDGYEPGKAQQAELFRDKMDIDTLFTAWQQRDILEWIHNHALPDDRGFVRFRVVLNEVTIGWENDIMHSNIAHAGYRDGCIYIGEKLLASLFGSRDSIPLRKMILDDDEYMHLVDKNFDCRADKAAYEERLKAVATQRENIEFISFLEDSSREQEEAARKRKEEARRIEEEKLAAKEKREKEIAAYLYNAREQLEANEFDKARSFIRGALGMDKSSQGAMELLNRINETEKAYKEEEQERIKREEEKAHKEEQERLKREEEQREKEERLKKQEEEARKREAAATGIKPIEAGLEMAGFELSGKGKESLLPGEVTIGEEGHIEADAGPNGFYTGMYIWMSRLNKTILENCKNYTFRAIDDKNLKYAVVKTKDLILFKKEMVICLQYLGKFNPAIPPVILETLLAHVFSYTIIEFESIVRKFFEEIHIRAEKHVALKDVLPAITEAVELLKKMKGVGAAHRRIMERLQDYMGKILGIDTVRKLGEDIYEKFDKFKTSGIESLMKLLPQIIVSEEALKEIKNYSKALADKSSDSQKGLDKAEPETEIPLEISEGEIEIIEGEIEEEAEIVEDVVEVVAEQEEAIRLAEEEAGKRAEEEARRIEEAGKRAEEEARRIEEAKGVDINAVMECILEKFETDVKRWKRKTSVVGFEAGPVKTARGFDADLPRVPLDDLDKFKRAMSHITENAFQAMPWGGTLTVKTELINNGKNVKITIRDEGEGIPDKDIIRIFEPGYSTKRGKDKVALSERKGMGLDTARRFIEKENGSIKVESEGKDKGTNVSIILPVSKESEGEETRRERLYNYLCGRDIGKKLTILLVCGAGRYRATSMALTVQELLYQQRLQYWINAFSAGVMVMPQDFRKDIVRKEITETVRKLNFHEEVVEVFEDSYDDKFKEKQITQEMLEKADIVIVAAQRIEKNILREFNNPRRIQVPGIEEKIILAKDFIDIPEGESKDIHDPASKEKRIPLKALILQMWDVFDAGLRPMLEKLRAHHLGEDRDLSGPKAGKANPLIEKLIRDKKIVEIFVEKGRLIAHPVRWIDGYQPGTEYEELLVDKVNIDELFTRDQQKNIIDWIQKHQTSADRHRGIRFRIVRDNTALGWVDDIGHSNITHAGYHDGCIYIGQHLLASLFDVSDDPIREMVLDEDEYKHLTDRNFDCRADKTAYKNRLKAVGDRVKEIMLKVDIRKSMEEDVLGRHLIEYQKLGSENILEAEQNAKEFIDTIYRIIQDEGKVFKSREDLARYLTQRFGVRKFIIAGGKGTRFSPDGIVVKQLFKSDNYNTNIKQSRKSAAFGKLEDVVVVGTVTAFHILKVDIKISKEIKKKMCSGLRAVFKELVKINAIEKDKSNALLSVIDGIIEKDMEYTRRSDGLRDLAMAMSLAQEEVNRIVGKESPMAEFLVDKISYAIFKEIMDKEDYLNKEKQDELFGENCIVILDSGEGHGSAYVEALNELEAMGKLRDARYSVIVHADSPGWGLDKYPNYVFISYLKTVNLISPATRELPKVTIAAKNPVDGRAKGRARVFVAKTKKFGNIPVAIKEWNKMMPEEQQGSENMAKGRDVTWFTNANILICDTAWTRRNSDVLWREYRHDLGKKTKQKQRPLERWTSDFLNIAGEEYTKLAQSDPDAAPSTRLISIGPYAPNANKTLQRALDYRDDLQKEIIRKIKDYDVEVDRDATIAISGNDVGPNYDLDVIIKNTFGDNLTGKEKFGNTRLKGNIHLGSEVKIGKGARLDGTRRCVSLTGKCIVERGVELDGVTSPNGASKKGDTWVYDKNVFYRYAKTRITGFPFQDGRTIEGTRVRDLNFSELGLIADNSTMVFLVKNDRKKVRQKAEEKIRHEIKKDIGTDDPSKRLAVCLGRAQEVLREIKELDDPYFLLIRKRIDIVRAYVKMALETDEENKEAQDLLSEIDHEETIAILKRIFGNKRHGKQVIDQIFLYGSITLEETVRIENGTMLDGRAGEIILLGQTHVQKGVNIKGVRAIDTFFAGKRYLNIYHYNQPAHEKIAFFNSVFSNSYVEYSGTVENSTVINSYITSGAEVIESDVEDEIVVGDDEIEGRRLNIKNDILSASIEGWERGGRDYIPGAYRLEEKMPADRAEIKRYQITYAEKLYRRFIQDELILKRMIEDTKQFIESKVIDRFTLQQIRQYMIAKIRENVMEYYDDPESGLLKSFQPLVDNLRACAKSLMKDVLEMDVKDEARLKELFRKVVILATRANIIDFSIDPKAFDLKHLSAVGGEKGQEFNKLLDEFTKKELGIDGLDRFEEMVFSPRKGAFLYFTDNIGESEFDALIWEFLARMGHTVVIAAKDGFSFADIDTEGVKEIINEHPSLAEHNLAGKIRVIKSGSSSEGVFPHKFNEDLRGMLKDKNLVAIIAKGQANLFTLPARNRIKVPVVTMLLSKSLTSDLVTGVSPQKVDKKKIFWPIIAVVPRGISIMTYEEETGDFTGTLERFGELHAEIKQIKELDYFEMPEVVESLVQTNIKSGFLKKEYRDGISEVPVEKSSPICKLLDRSHDPHVKSIKNILRLRKAFTCTLCKVPYKSSESARFITKDWEFSVNPEPLFASQIIAINRRHVNQGFVDRGYYLDMFRMLENLEGWQISWPSMVGTRFPEHLHVHIFRRERPMPVEKYPLEAICRNREGKGVVYTVKNYPDRDHAITVFVIPGSVKEPDIFAKRCVDLEMIMKSFGYDVDKFITRGRKGELKVFFYPRINGLSKGISSVDMSGIWVISDEKQYSNFKLKDVYDVLSRAALNVYSASYQSLSDAVKRHFYESEGVGLFPPSMDLLVTDKCNLNCPVCWGSFMPKHESVGIEKQKKMIDVMYENGMRRMIFTGGEPLLEENLVELLKYAKEKGITTQLFTNGLLMDEKRADEIMPYVDMITLSLDGYDDQTNSLNRKLGHFDAIMRVLDIMKRKYFQKDIQILTVVTAQNKDYIHEIGALLSKVTKGLQKFQWKLNYYKRIGRSQEKWSIQEDKYLMSYRDFEDLAKRIQREAEDEYGIRVRYSPPEHDKAYLFVFPDGTLATTVGAKYLELGNVLSPETLDSEGNIQIFREITDNIRKRIVVHVPAEDIGAPDLKRHDIMGPEGEELIEKIFEDITPDVRDHAKRVKKIARVIAWRLGSEDLKIDEEMLKLLDMVALLHDIGAEEKYYSAFKEVLERINYGIHHPPADRSVKHGRVEPAQISLLRWATTKAISDENIPKEEITAALRKAQETGDYYPVYRLYIKYVALRRNPGEDLSEKEETVAQNIFNHGKRSVELLREKKVKIPVELELLISHHHDYNTLERRLQEMVDRKKLKPKQRDMLQLLATIFIVADVFEMGNNYERIVKAAGRSRVENFSEIFDVFDGFMWKRFNQTERIKDTRAIEALKGLLAVETAEEGLIIMHPAIEKVIAEARNIRYADDSRWLTDGDRRFQRHVVEQRRRKAVEEEPFVSEYEIAVGMPLKVYNKLKKSGHMDELKDIQGVSAIIRIGSSEKDNMLQELAEKTQGTKCISALIDADVVDTEAPLVEVTAELKEIIADFVAKAREDIIRLANPEIGELTEESVKAIKDINALKNIMRILLRVQPYSRSYHLSEKSVRQMRIENTYNSFYAQKARKTKRVKYLEKAVQNFDRYYLVHYADGREIFQDKDLAIVPPGLEIQKRREIQKVSRLMDAYHDKFFIVAPAREMTDEEKEEFKTKIMDFWMLDEGVVSRGDVVILDRVDEGYRTSGLYLMADDLYEGVTKTNTGFRCLNSNLEYDEIAKDLNILQLDLAQDAKNNISQYEVFVNLFVSRDYNISGLKRSKKGFYIYLPAAKAVSLEAEIRKYYDRYLKEVLIKA